MARSKDILGMNARTLNFIRPYNKRPDNFQIDNKILTKRLLEKAHLPTPKIYHVFETPYDVESFDFTKLPPSFVIKPNRGFGGSGILVVYGKRKDTLVDNQGKEVSIDQIRLHLLDILDGNFSMFDIPDVAFIEQKIKVHRAFRRLTYRGTPDIRIIVFNKVPVMAMMRLPTSESGGRANLHQGAIGIGIDIASGITTNSIYKHQRIKYLPGTKIKLNGLKIPSWDEILHIASESQFVSRVGFLGVDIVLDRDEGPMVLELNVRPGLEIQNANRVPLYRRLRRVEDLEVKSPEKGISISKELFASGLGPDEDKVVDKTIVGHIEEIKIIGPNKKKVALKAKIDTGAGLTSICEEVAAQIGYQAVVDGYNASELVKNPKTKNVATPADIKERNAFLNIPGVIGTTIIRSANGITRRVMVPIKIIMKKQKFETVATIIKRSHLEYPVIIGRRSLKSYLIDPAIYQDKKDKK
jgi:alpha-L-glutamate ligase-like protein